MNTKLKPTGPTTPAQMLAAIHDWGGETEEVGERGFEAVSPSGGRTRLDAGDFDSAVFEAYHLLKP